MADRQAGPAGHDGARTSKPVRRRPGPRRRFSPEAFLSDLGASRPPCSVAERDIADAVGRRMRASRLKPVVETARAPTSPTWVPLIRTLFRVWAAAFLAAGWQRSAIGLAAGAVLLGIGWLSGLIRFIPLLGSRTRNVIALRRGKDREARPLVVCAHLDTHITAGAPMHPLHAVLTSVSAWIILVAAVFTGRATSGWRPAAAFVAVECVITLAWLARRELETPKRPPDDNTSGVIALLRTSEMLMGDQPRCDVWLVATGAGTSGSYGFSAFLRKRPELRDAWVVEIDALGAGEVIAAPLSARFPHPGTPQSLVRAVTAAARASNDPLTVRRVARPHSDARAALRRRTPAIVLTAGLRPPTAGGAGPDPANAERAARVVTRLARLKR